MTMERIIKVDAVVDDQIQMENVRKRVKHNFEFV